jgi:hypothetical protein
MGEREEVKERGEKKKGKSKGRLILERKLFGNLISFHHK